MALDTFLTKLFDLFKRRPISDLSEQEKYYRARIENVKTDHINDVAQLKKHYEEQLAEIRSHRHKHLDNGVELDAWQARANEAYMKLIAVNQANRDLREQIIFLTMELEIIKKAGTRKSTG